MTRLIKIFYLSLFFLTPIIFTFQNSELFELPKMYFVYTLTLFILIAHSINYLRHQTVLFKNTPLDWPLLIFLSSQILSTFFSVDVHTSIFGYYSRLNGGLLSLICYFLLYKILTTYINESFKNKIIDLSLLSGLLIVLYGITQHFGIDKHIWVQDVQSRVFSTLGQPNWLAAYLCILLPFIFDKLLNSKNKHYSFIFFLLSFIFYLCLLFTKSKSGIIAAIISLGIYFLLKFKTHLFRSSFIFLSYIILTLAIQNPIRDYIFPPKNENLKLKIENLNITPSGDIRKIVWQGSLKLWQQFPIFGTGPETFGYTYYWTRPASHNLTSEWDFLYNKAHNEYLNYLATTGTFGFLSYLILILSILYSIRNTSYLIPFISILITNYAGFSVVITSLYFFLLPALLPANPPPPPKTQNRLFKYTSYLLIAIFVYLTVKNLIYYLADITYANAETSDNQQLYSQALNQITISLNHRPNEPVYLTKYANILSKLALQSTNQKLAEQSLKYTTQSIEAINQAILISPFSVNLWKERAQIFYYLSVVDSKYYLNSIDALTKATLLAPTDAKSYYMLAEFYNHINKTDQAVKNYQKAIELKSNYDHAYFALAKTYFNQKKYDLAKENFDKTLQIAPANTDVQNYLTLIATISAKKK